MREQDAHHHRRCDIDGGGGGGGAVRLPFFRPIRMCSCSSFCSRIEYAWPDDFAASPLLLWNSAPDGYSPPPSLKSTLSILPSSALLLRPATAPRRPLLLSSFSIYANAVVVGWPNGIWRCDRSSMLTLRGSAATISLSVVFCFDHSVPMRPEICNSCSFRGADLFDRFMPLLLFLCAFARIEG